VVWIDEQSVKSRNQAANKKSANTPIKSVGDAVEKNTGKQSLKIVRG
jgi:hypothetical protein